MKTFNPYFLSEHQKLLRQKLHDYSQYCVASTDDEVNFLLEDLIILFPEKINAMTRDHYLFVFRNLLNSYDAVLVSKTEVDSLCQKYQMDLYKFHRKWKKVREPSYFEMTLFNEGIGNFHMNEAM